MGKVEIASSALSAPPRNDVVAEEDIRRLLDVIASIIADEYIQIAKQNKDVFSNGGGK